MAVALSVLKLAVMSHPANAAEDVVGGKIIYQTQCSLCHSVDGKGIGPQHRNVVGRAVASVAGYDYSPALKKLGGTWTPSRLDEWLSGTQKMAPGNKMFFEVDDPVQRRMIVAYLQSVSVPSATE